MDNLMLSRVESLSTCLKETKDETFPSSINLGGTSQHDRRSNTAGTVWLQLSQVFSLLLLKTWQWPSQCTVYSLIYGFGEKSLQKFHFRDFCLNWKLQLVKRGHKSGYRGKRQLKKMEQAIACQKGSSKLAKSIKQGSQRGGPWT